VTLDENTCHPVTFDQSRHFGSVLMDFNFRPAHLPDTCSKVPRWMAKGQVWMCAMITGAINHVCFVRMPWQPFLTASTNHDALIYDMQPDTTDRVPGSFVVLSRGFKRLYLEDESTCASSRRQLTGQKNDNHILFA